MSALVRGEFLLIQTAFDHMPRITTTGLFDTVFNQLGNYTFTLPGVPGTLATTANIATETTRALAAEAVLGTAVGTETTARIAGDATEAAARTAAIGVETTARTAADTAEVTARNTAIGVETTRATTAEGANATAAAAAQTTANAALPKAGGTMTGDVNFDGHAVTNLATATIGAVTATTGNIAGLTATAAVIGSATIGPGGSFLASLGASGYQKLPSGLILQWGNNTTAPGGGVASGYAISFPAAVYGFFPEIWKAVGPLANIIVAGTPGLTSCIAWVSDTSGAGVNGVTFNWFALGS